MYRDVSKKYFLMTAECTPVLYYCQTDTTNFVSSLKIYLQHNKLTLIFNLYC